MTLEEQAKYTFCPALPELIREPLRVSEPLQGPQSASFCQGKQSRDFEGIERRELAYR